MIALLALTMAAEPVVVDTAPSKATVYADQARVSRTGSATLPAGVQAIAFTNLPPNIDSSTLTADLRGSAELLGIEVRHVAAAEAADARVAEIEEQLWDLRDEKQDRLDDADAARVRLRAAQQARAASAAQLSAQLLVGSNGPARATALERALSEEDAAARDAVRIALVAIRDVDARIAALERERAQLGASTTDTYTAVVRLDVSRGGTVTVDLNYAIYGASWRPRYDLRGDPTSGDVDLSLSAIVSNLTGEDWSDVALSVSSARPGRGTDVPTLDPFWLTLYRPRPQSRSGRASAAPAAMAVADSYDMAMEAPAAPMEIREAAVDIQLAATTFTVDGAEDIPADGTERKVLLTTVDLESALRHVAVPRLDPAAYLVGEVTNSATFPLLPGEAGVFAGGAYVGDVWLDTVPPGETFDVSFGPDDRVAVRRTRVATTTGDAGPVGRRQRAEWGWSVAVTSQHPAAIAVEILEQVPLSPRDDVEVAWSIDRGSPTPEEKDGGVLSFPLSVPARGSAAVGWGYTITYPGDLSPRWME